MTGMDALMPRAHGCAGAATLTAPPHVSQVVISMSPKAPTVGTLQTLPAVEVDDRYAQVAKDAGFSLHAGVAANVAVNAKVPLVTVL